MSLDNRTIGLLGGGQLGRMLLSEAHLLGLKVLILDDGPSTPAKQLSSLNAEHVSGSFSSPSAIRELASKVDVLTVEIEHVDAGVLEEIEREGRVVVAPSSRTIRVIQDKFAQKEHLSSAGIPVADYAALEEATPNALEAVAEQLGGYPLMLKARTQAYDGKGNYLLRSSEDGPAALEALSKASKGGGLYAEALAPFVAEIAVMVVRGHDGEVRSYPAVETVHEDSICSIVWAPLLCADETVQSRAREVAEKAVAALWGAGVFGVEMFLMADGTLLLNEIAPRPHNSGHYTIEACATSQYANHLRAILSLPLGATSLVVPASGMLNLLGRSDDPEPGVLSLARAALSIEGAHVHLYGKAGSRKGRKMGHITVVGESSAAVRHKIQSLLHHLPSSEARAPLSALAHISALHPTSGTPARPHSDPMPLVSIVMGSDSDLAVMLPASHILARFNIPYELSIVSAHRTPDRMVRFAKSAAARGVRVIVAGAGGAAHLPGMVAAMTPLPVIGVPVKGSSLDGVDSLHSIVQMPRGIPVATVAINGGMNAGLLAVRVLSAGIPRLVGEMERYLAGLEDEVHEKIERIEEGGWETWKGLPARK